MDAADLNLYAKYLTSEYSCVCEYECAHVHEFASCKSCKPTSCIYLWLLLANSAICGQMILLSFHGVGTNIKGKAR